MNAGLLSLDETARELFGVDISRDAARARLRRLVAADAIKIIKSGRRVWIPRSAVNEIKGHELAIVAEDGDG
jgi:hypothetical protein